MNNNKHLNILLITSDQQRWDALGCVKSHVKTPNLDALAADGILFERAYTVNPVCTPSRCSLLTGQYPSRHGCFHVGTSLPEQDCISVADILGDNGYFTALLGKSHFNACRDPDSIEAAPFIHNLDYYNQWEGPFYGFERVKLVIGHTSEPHACGMHYGAWLREKGIPMGQHFDIHDYNAHGTWNLPEEAHGTYWVAEETIQAINHAQELDKLFFAWASFQDPHNPYVVPEPWDKLYDPVEIPDLSVPEESTEGKPPFYESLQEGDFYGDDPELQENNIGDCKIRPELNERNIKEVHAAYLGMVSLMDQGIGKIIQHLKDTGIYENTLIVFTSDHGDYLGEHQLWGKGLPAYEDIQRIPFIVRYPGCTSGRSHALQSIVDIPQTFMAVSESPLPPGIQGVDQSASWLNPKIHSREWAMLEFRPAESSFMQRTYIEDTYKLVLYHDRDYGELYNLQKDPRQMNNLYEDPEYREIKYALIRRYIDAEMERDGIMRKRKAEA